MEQELKQDETKAIANDAPAIDVKAFNAVVQRLDKLEAKGFPAHPPSCKAVPMASKRRRSPDT